LDGIKVPTLEESLLAVKAEAIAVTEMAAAAEANAAAIENKLTQEKQAR
jgi:hypothetical protein